MPVMASMPRSYRASGEVLCAKAIVLHSTRIEVRIVRRMGGSYVRSVGTSIGNTLGRCRVTKVPRDGSTGGGEKKWQFQKHRMWPKEPRSTRSSCAGGYFS